jgi:transcriptional regulator with XRE-family HTH domain
MANHDETGALRLVVVFLRFYAGMTQGEFGKAARVDQSEISKFEKGSKTPPEEILRRMAQAADVSWPVVVHLRRAYGTILAAGGRPGAAPESETLSPEQLEPALLALTPYLLAEGEAERLRSLERDRREAEEIWAALERYPIPRRRSLIEQAPRASRSCALAARICVASLGAAPHDFQKARELADLALLIAGRVPEEERSGAVEMVKRVLAEIGAGQGTSGTEGGATS